MIRPTILIWAGVPMIGGLVVASMGGLLVQFFGLLASVTAVLLLAANVVQERRRASRLRANREGEA